MKKTVTPQKAADTFGSAQRINTLMELVDIEFNKHLIDHRFKDPTMNNHVRRIKESSGAIRKYSSLFIKSKDEEYFKWEHCTALSVLFDYFMFMPIEVINDALNQIEAIKKEMEHGEA